MSDLHPKKRWNGTGFRCSIKQFPLSRGDDFHFFAEFVLNF